MAAHPPPATVAAVLADGFAVGGIATAIGFLVLFLLHRRLRRVLRRPDGLA